MVAVTHNMYRAFKPVAHEKSFTVENRWAPHYLPMKNILVQGADPTHEEILARDNNFQGGYRCTLNIKSPCAYGRVEVAADHIGFDYYPPHVGWTGLDAFSYSVTNIFGQESDAKCVFIAVGLNRY